MSGMNNTNNKQQIATEWSAYIQWARQQMSASKSQANTLLWFQRVARLEQALARFLTQ